MTTDKGTVERAMDSVVEAHRILGEFHKEVVAFYRIVDDQLAEGRGHVRLETKYPDYIVRYQADKMTEPGNWLPKWMGRTYSESSDGQLDGAMAEDPTSSTSGGDHDTLVIAFVWIVAAASPSEAPGFVRPECWIGVADPGTQSRFKDAYEFGRKGAWSEVGTSEARLGAWEEGRFIEETKQFGKGGSWKLFRIPLADLLDADAIRQRVTLPLKEKFAELVAERARKVRAAAPRRTR